MNRNRLNNTNKPGFEVPKDYFKNFEDILLSELNLKKKIKNSGFTVPENYFKSLENNIINTVKKEKEPTKVINLFSWKKSALVASIAASIILMFHIVSSKKDSLTIDTIDTASIESYILNEDIATADIASLFPNDDLNNFYPITVNFNAESLENYVFDNLEIDDLISN